MYCNLTFETCWHFWNLGTADLGKWSCLVLKSGSWGAPRLFGCLQLPRNIIVCRLSLYFEEKQRIKMRNCLFLCSVLMLPTRCHQQSTNPPVDSRSISGGENMHWIINKTRQKHQRELLRKKCFIISTLSQTETCKSLYCFWMNIVKPFPLFLSPVCQRREGKEAATAGERVLLERRRHLPPSPHHVLPTWGWVKSWQ